MVVVVEVVVVGVVGSAAADETYSLPPPPVRRMVVVVVAVALGVQGSPLSTDAWLGGLVITWEEDAIEDSKGSSLPLFIIVAARGVM